MSKERYNQIIDDIYKNYLIEDVKILPNMSKEKMTEMGFRLSKEELINKCITDNKFSKKWGLKIEERELSSAEMWEWYTKNGGPNGKTLLVSMIVYQNEEDNSHIKSWLEKWAPNVPTKQITLTYQNETIQFYE